MFYAEIAYKYKGEPVSMKFVAQDMDKLTDYVNYIKADEDVDGMALIKSTYVEDVMVLPQDYEL